MTALLGHPEWGTYRQTGIAGLSLHISGSNKFARSVKKKLLRYFANKEGIVDIEHNGLRFRCHIADSATERNIVISGNRQNGRRVDAILRHVPDGGTFMDVGANCGLFTLAAAAKVGSGGRVLAIEPSPIMVNRLRFNIAANAFSNIEVFPTAIGEKTGIATLNLNLYQLGKSSLVAFAKSQEKEVSISTLLSVVEQSGIDGMDALKIDVEGYEERVLSPFIESAPRSLWPRAILMETKWSKYWREDCLARAISEGYAIQCQEAGDVLLVRVSGRTL